MTWNMAALRARNYRTYKPAKPVGEHKPIVRHGFSDGMADKHCGECGYHVCSCPPPKASPFAVCPCGQPNNVGHPCSLVDASAAERLALTQYLQTGNWNVRHSEDPKACLGHSERLGDCDVCVVAREAQRYRFPVTITPVAEKGRLYWFTGEGIISR